MIADQSLTSVDKGGHEQKNGGGAHIAAIGAHNASWRPSFEFIELAAGRDVIVLGAGR